VPDKNVVYLAAWEKRLKTDRLIGFIFSVVGLIFMAPIIMIFGGFVLFMAAGDAFMVKRLEAKISAAPASTDQE
jgi:hypothetical protein